MMINRSENIEHAAVVALDLLKNSSLLR